MYKQLLTLLSLLFALTCSLKAKESGGTIKAQLRFNLWVHSEAQGLQTTGAGIKERGRYQGRLFLKQGEKFVGVNYREGRRTGEIPYNGEEQCVLYKNGGGDQVYIKICSVKLAKSGKYMIILRTSGSVKDPKFTPILIPHDDKHLKKGHVLFVNYTDRQLGLVLDADKKLTLIPNAMKSISLKEGAAGLHIEMHTKTREENDWKVADSKGYSIDQQSKSACILFQEKKGGAVKMKLFSRLK